MRNKNCFRIVLFLATIGLIIFISVPEVDAKGGGGARGGGSRGGGSRSGGGIRSSIKSSIKTPKLNSKMALVKMANKGKIKGPISTRIKGSSLNRKTALSQDPIRGPTRTRIKGMVKNNKFSSKMALVRLANTRKTRTNDVSGKRFAKKHWKKAAAFAGGAALVGGAALGYGLFDEIQDSFEPYIIGIGGINKGDDGDDSPYSFEDWERNSQLDGWVCRTDKDCDWINQRLGCDDNEFQISSVQGDWPWKSDLKGRCACEYGYWFDQDSWSCTLADDPVECQDVDCTLDDAIEYCPKTCEGTANAADDEESNIEEEANLSSKSHEDWELVADKKRCTPRKGASGKSLGYKSTIGECAQGCKEHASMFSYGTNDYGSNGCTDSGCFCICETAASSDGTCSQTDNVGLRLYKYD